MRRRLLPATLSVVLLALLAAGCLRAPRPGAPEAATPHGVVTDFMRRVVANDTEGGFRLLDIDSLVNYGRAQGEWYRAMPPDSQARYRKDFVEGIYAFFFRDMPPELATFAIVAPDPSAPVVEVTGRPGKQLRFTLKTVGGEWRIVRLDKL